MSETGEPMTWKTSDPVDTSVNTFEVPTGDEDGSTTGIYGLCRCGSSTTKPFCDHQFHETADWDDTSQAPTDNYNERAVSLGGTGIEIFDDRPTCVHAGFCGNDLTSIWKMAEQTGDSRIRAQAMAMIKRCPSGALAFAVDDEVIEPDLPVEVAVVPDGPLWVTGGIGVQRSDGEPFEARNRVALCRCGASSRKPLCDGTHKEIGFKG
ncbi:MAG: iron-binding protein [Actinomycetia bacterium]|nr:iron-binding protein [Actinomycetes bacterium]